MAGRSGRFLVYRSYWPVNVRVNYRSGLQVASLQACVCRANEQHIGVFDGSIFCFLCARGKITDRKVRVKFRPENGIRCGETFETVKKGSTILYVTTTSSHDTRTLSGKRNNWKSQCRGLGRRTKYVDYYFAKTIKTFSTCPYFLVQKN